MCEKVEWLNSVLVVINVRLGLHNIPHNYFKVIQKYMKFKQFVGLIGGKPNFAYYFFGFKEPDNLLFLDPHKVQSHVENIEENYEEHRTKYHCNEVRSVCIEKLDPSMGFCFLLKTHEDYSDFVS